jgi:iron-sulfur cluster repair protein YtfE (RIC family)
MTVSSAVRKVGKTVMDAVGAKATDPAAKDLLDTLKAEHDEVKELLEQLEQTDTAARRKLLVQNIKLALIPHTKAEEKVLYAAIVALRDKDAQTDGHEGYIEHDLAAKTLQKLSGIANATSTEHKACAKVLKELVTHHIGEEESNVWSDAKKHFSTAERKAMNESYLIAKGRVRLP